MNYSVLFPVIANYFQMINHCDICNVSNENILQFYENYD